MFGGQQIGAYKTMMTPPHSMPRHTESDVRLFRVIAWGAVMILAAFIAAVVAEKIASFKYSSDPVFVAAIPIALVLLWWELGEMAPRSEFRAEVDRILAIDSTIVPEL